MIKANFIFSGKNDPKEFFLSIPAAPAKGDLVYIDGNMYRVFDFF